MPVFYPIAGSIWLAGEVQDLLAASLLKLFQSTIVPDVNTTLAELTAEEATFSGYAPITLTTWFEPYISPSGGAAINSPAGQFDTDNPTTVTNNIGGAWIETATGDLVAIITFPEIIPMAMPFQSIPLSEVLRFTSGL